MQSIKLLLFIGLFITPFTQLRFGFIGFGELSVLASFLLILLYGKTLTFSLLGYSKILRQFFLSYFALIICGFVVNFLFGFNSGKPGSDIFNFLSYTFVFVLICMLSLRSLFSRQDIAKFFSLLFLSWSVAYSFLFVISLFTPSLGPFSLTYATYFAPLVDNVHQSASILCVLPPLLIALASILKSSSSKYSLLFLSYFLFYIALQTGSLKAILGTSIALCITTPFVFTIFFPSFKFRLPIIPLTFLLLIGLIFSVNYELFTVDGLITLFREADPRGSRAMIYFSSLGHFLQNPLFGYGPGSHTPHVGGYWDAHNTYLTLILEGGFFAFILGIQLIIRLFRRFLLSPFLLAAFLSWCVYFSGGDVLRRVPSWLLLMGMMIFFDFEKTYKSGLQ